MVALGVLALLAVAGWWFSKPYVEAKIGARIESALARRGFTAQVTAIDWDRRGHVTVGAIDAQRPDTTMTVRGLAVTASMHHLLRGRLQLTAVHVDSVSATRTAKQTAGDAEEDSAQEDRAIHAPKSLRPAWFAPGAPVDIETLRLVVRGDAGELARVRLTRPKIEIDAAHLTLKGAGELTVRERVAPVDIDATFSRDSLRAEAVARDGVPLVEFAAAPHGVVRVGAATIERRDGALLLRAGQIDAVLGDIAAPTIRMRARVADLDRDGGVSVEDGTLHLGADPRRAVGHARALLAALRGQLEGQAGAPAIQPLVAVDPPFGAPASAAPASAALSARTVRLKGFAIHTTPEHPLMTDATVRVSGSKIEVSGTLGGGTLTAGWHAGQVSLTADDVGLDTTWNSIPMGGRFTGTATLSREPVRLVLDGRVADGRVHHPAVATDPISGINAGFKGTIEVGEGSISFEKARISLGAATAVTTLKISKLPADPLTLRDGLPDPFKPVIDLRAEVEPLRCDAAIKGVPAAILGPLQDVDLAGFFHPTIRLRLPFGQPTKVRFEATGISKNGCEVDHLHLRAAGQPNADVAAPLDDVGWLNADFVLPVREGVSEGKTIEVGPGTPDYVALEAMPGYVGGAAYLSEEMGFYVGSGISIPLIAKALGTNLTYGRFAYGGSTVTQQLVKNLFLTRKKTLARKFQEAIIAARIARAVSKARVLELYLNCIEFGPDLYGIGRASQHYFQKGAHSLTPMEAVFLAMLKPAPRRGAWYRRQGRTPKMPYWDKRARLLLERLETRGLAPTGTADGAAPYSLRWADGRYLGPTRAKPLAPTSLESPDWD